MITLDRMARWPDGHEEFDTCTAGIIYLSYQFLRGALLE